MTIKAGDKARRRLMFALFSLSDRLCAHRWSFEIGHQVGELGWKLRRPAGTFTEQEG